MPPSSTSPLTQQPAEPCTVLITGSSGMLGRSLNRLLFNLQPKYVVVGTGLSRSEPPLRRLDLLDKLATASIIDEIRPGIVVHCAAERDPDAFETNWERATALNVDAVANVAKECARVGARLFFISTSYVFDGGAVTGVGPPYFTDSKTHPLNRYGESKLKGEAAAQSIPGARAVVVRVPLLFGEDCDSLLESAALSSVNAILGKKPVRIDDWALRFPTSVEDVAQVVRRLIDADVPSGVYHVSSSEGITKFGIAQLQADILGVDGSHVLPGDGPPPGSAPRPQCTQLDCSETWKVLGNTVHDFAPLRDAMTRALAKFSA